eukprot:CAMPEP_0117446906 /NCGR_PEP_ID=MMETSP0759-20121206/6591_1 /TAXON_ID=63605 /ORGANISM="Percolomonas cosmopolitus, Strain WS" /LENGTH=2125 /DNA_ID=CAMNT_0005239205 /DNA_START=370 /DNA_END=6744 /DNA_ORIENTATION=-
MSSSSHMLNGQIIELVNRLNPQTQGMCYQELEQLIKSYGYDTYKCLLRALIDAVDFHTPHNLTPHENMSPQQQADQTRVNLLKHVLQILMQQDNFMSIAVEVFDTFPTSKGELIRLMARKLNLGPYHLVLMGLSLLQSTNQQTKIDGVQLLKEEILKQTPLSLPDNIAHHLLYTIQQSPLFARDRDSLVKELQTMFGPRSHTLPLVTNPQYPQGGMMPNMQQKVDPQQLHNELRLGRLFREIGYVATASTDAVRDVFRIYQKDLGDKKVSAQAIACLIGELVSTHQGLKSSPETFQHFLRQFGESPTKHATLQDPGTWKMENLATVLKENISHLDWSNIIERLDYPDFRLPDKKSLALLVFVQEKSSDGKPFPIEKIVTRMWNNRASQLQFCLLGLSFPPSTLSFSSDKLHEVDMGERLQQSAPPVQHAAWNNIEFIQTLLNLAEGDKYQVVQQQFEKAIQQAPERLFIGIVEAQPSNRILQSELLLNQLIPKFVKNSTTKDRDALAVLDQFLLVSPLLFSRSLSEVFTRDQSSIDTIVNILQELKATEMVLSCAPAKFSTYLAITASAKQNNLLNFSLWLKSVLVLNGPAYLPAFIEYLQAKLPSIDLSQKEQKTQLEYIAPLFRWIPLLNSNVTSTDLQRVISSNAGPIPNPVWEEIYRLQGKPAFSVPKEIENNADEHLKKIFKGTIPIENATELLKQMKQSSNDSDKKLYACMIHNLYDEYRFFPKYSDQDLAKASSLFGAIISNDIIKGKSLELAKYFIFTALHSNDTRMLQFALLALSECKHRLREWPHFCAFLKTLPPATFMPIPELMQEIDAAVKSKSATQRLTKKATSTPDSNIEDKEKIPSIYGEMKDAQTMVLHDGEEIELPNEEVQNNVGFLFNNLSVGSSEVFEEKAKSLKTMVEAKHYPFLCYYIVVDRASNELGQQNTYVQLISSMHDKDFEKRIMYQTYKAINTLLSTPLKKENSHERKTLKTLGEWLGRLTLERNRPILVKELDIEKLLLQAFETGKLPAVAAFVGKVMSHCLVSDAFKPPNPWTVMILSLLKEIHDHPEVDLSVRFDVEILSKHLGIKLQDIAARDKPFLVNLKLGHYAGTQEGIPAPTEREFDPSHLPEVSIQLTELNNEVVISPSLDIFVNYPALKVYVVYALEQAIREVIPPVVKRSITIACRTTLELVTKDFVFDADATKFRRSAVLMASGLASKLALVTCKEPLMTSLRNHLRAFLDAAVIQRSESLSQKIDETCRIITESNLGLGCVYVEENAKEKAGQTILEALAQEIEQRNKCFASGGQVPWTLTQQNPFLHQMPEALVPPHGVQSFSLRAYESFANMASSLSTANSNLEGHTIPTTPNATHPQMQQQQPIPSAASAHMRHPLQSVQLPQSQTTTKMTFEEVAELVNKYLKNMLAHAQKLKQDTRLASLRPESDIIQHLVLIPKLLKNCEDISKISTFLADNMLRISYDPNRNQNPFMKDVYIYFLKCSTQVSPEIVKEISVWWSKLDDQNQKYNDISLRFLMDGILDFPIVDEDLGRAISSGNGQAIRFAVEALKEGVQVSQRYRIECFADTLYQLSLISNQLPPQHSSIVIDMYTKAAKGRNSITGYDADIENGDEFISRFEEWVVLYQKDASVSRFEQFVTTRMQKSRLLTTDSDFRHLCKSLTKYVLERFYTDLEKMQQENPNMSSQDIESVSSLFLYIDAYCKLVVTIIVMSTDDDYKFELLDKAVSVAMKYIIRDREMFPEKFNQRAYERIFSSLMIILADTYSPETYYSLISSFANNIFMVRPQTMPEFAFAWVDLISHRNFMPVMLSRSDSEDAKVNRQNFCEFMRHLFNFLRPHLEKQKLSEPIKHLYKATLRILLVLLHDFSEFLCDYHFELCDEISPNCIQMRNLVLSAFPRHMRLPDPFTPNLKVDLLPEIQERPNILSDFAERLELNKLKEPIDFYLKNRNQPQILNDLIPALLLPTQRTIATGQRYNVGLINSLVLYVGVNTIEYPNSTNPDLPAMDIFKKLIYEMDSEGRYHVLNAIANQLRFPNSHTYYFSRVILYLFGYVKLQDDEELIQEQITRVVFERLIANRPHPWGLLVTFIELVRNRIYGFFDKEFIRCAPEITSIFNNVKPTVDKQ